MKPQIKNYINLHFIVLIWGFTGILGKLITIETFHLVWYRLFISVSVLLGIILFKKEKLSTEKSLRYLGMGIVVALHWLCFYGAIKVSNVSVALSAFSCTAFFTALIEPLIFRRKINKLELLPGVLVIIGMYIIFNAEFQYAFGILLGILAALTSSIFGTYNGLWTHRNSSIEITFFELTGALISLSIYILASPQIAVPNFDLSLLDWLWLSILAVGCTIYPFIASINLMKHFKPFMVSLTVNLEPIYSIILAIFIFGSSEYMNVKFYIGASLTILAVFTYPIIKKKRDSY